MQVYAVIGGWNYQGESFDSLRLFDCWSTADAYREHLCKNGGCDYALIEVCQVEMQSAIAV